MLRRAGGRLMIGADARHSRSAGGQMNQVYAFFVGDKTVPRSQFMYRDPSPDNCTIAFYFWLILTPRGPVVVDCSFSAAEAKGRGIVNYRDRAALLASCGVRPQDVATVVMTHLHYDHWSGHDLFPNATYFVQEREIEFWQGPGRATPMFAASADLEAIDAVEPLRQAGRIRTVRGDWTLQQGIDMRLIGGHTPGLQVLVVEGEVGRVVLANDAFHFYENLEQLKPVQVTVNMLEAVTAMKTVLQLAGGDATRAIPGHDPAVMDRFPTIAPGVVRIA